MPQATLGLNLPNACHSCERDPGLDAYKRGPLPLYIENCSAFTPLSFACHLHPCILRCERSYIMTFPAPQELSSCKLPVSPGQIFPAPPHEPLLAAWTCSSPVILFLFLQPVGAFCRIYCKKGRAQVGPVSTGFMAIAKLAQRCESYRYSCHARG